MFVTTTTTRDRYNKHLLSFLWEPLYCHWIFMWPINFEDISFKSSLECISWRKYQEYQTTVMPGDCEYDKDFMWVTFKKPFFYVCTNKKCIIFPTQILYKLMLFLFIYVFIWCGNDTSLLGVRVKSTYNVRWIKISKFSSSSSSFSHMWSFADVVLNGETTLSNIILCHNQTCCFTEGIAGGTCVGK